MTNAIEKRDGLLSRVSAEELDRAALKAAGLDKVDKATQIVAMEMARRYGLELPLKHIVPIQGRLYVTRDGLLHVAHRSGQLDGIVLLEQGKGDGGWFAVVEVYRKDMSKPFRYRGRYNGKNKAYGPEMAIKTAECMALRRAFDISLCSREELWDAEEIKEAPPKVSAPRQFASAKEERRPAMALERPRVRTLEDARKFFPEIGPLYQLQEGDFGARYHERGVEHDSISVALKDAPAWQAWCERKVSGKIEAWRALSQRNRALVLWARELRAERKDHESRAHNDMVKECERFNLHHPENYKPLADSLGIPKRRTIENYSEEELKSILAAYEIELEEKAASAGSTAKGSVRAGRRLALEGEGSKHKKKSEAEFYRARISVHLEGFDGDREKEWARLCGLAGVGAGDMDGMENEALAKIHDAMGKGAK